MFGLAHWSWWLKFEKALKMRFYFGEIWENLFFQHKPSVFVNIRPNRSPIFLSSLTTRETCMANNFFSPYVANGKSWLFTSPPFLLFVNLLCNCIFMCGWGMNIEIQRMQNRVIQFSFIQLATESCQPGYRFVIRCPFCEASVLKWRQKRQENQFQIEMYRFFHSTLDKI